MKALPVLVRQSAAAHRAVDTLVGRVERLEALLVEWLDFDREHENGLPEKRRLALVKRTRRALGAKS